MGIVPGHRPRQRSYKADPHTFDLLDIERLPKSLVQDTTPPRFAEVIYGHGYTDELDLRSDFVRYMEDNLLPAGIARGNKNLVTVAEQSARAFRFYEQIVYLHKVMIDRMNESEDNANHQALLETFRQEVKVFKPDMKEAVELALKALNRQKYYTDEDLAMLLEIPYMALRGSKSLVIIATKRGRFYTEWAQKYPHLWTLRKGLAEFTDFYSGEGKDDDDDLDDMLRQGFNYADFHKSSRPIWWGDMNLGPFSRICRRLVKIKNTKSKPERKKRLHTPAMLLDWRTRPKPSVMLGSNDDYRT